MTSAKTIVDYYEVFEAALSSLAQERDEHRRHFGVPIAPAPAGYCWFKGVVAADRHPDFVDWLEDAGKELEDRLLAAMPRVQPRRMLDVGCGNGVLLRRIAREHPGVALTGINFQPTQVRTARRLLAGTNVELVEADFLNHVFPQRFDVAYLLESGFHMPNKAELGQRLASLLEPGGEAWLIDIVIAERAAETFGSLGRGALFSYVPRREWQAAFGAAGLEEVEFTDLSQAAADVLQISDIKLLESDYFTPRLRQALSLEAPVSDEKLAAAVTVMVQIATEYRRLSRLLRGGMLEYVLMRYRKAP